MHTVKILHCGDLHFDTPFSELPGTEAAKRKEDLRETFGEIIRVVKEEEVELLLISGDLFDNSSVMKNTIDYIVKKLREIPEVHVFIAPGNHDPYHYKSFYKIIQWPENVHVFSDKLGKIELENKNICIYGIGFSKVHEKECLIKDFVVEEESFINLMVLHGDVVGKGQGSDYNPVTEEDIERTGLDYLALGHRHSYSGINKCRQTSWAYSGNPEGRGFDELGSKGVIVGHIGKGHVNICYKEVCKRKYVNCAVDITGADTYEDIIIKINEKLGMHSNTDSLGEKIDEKRRNLYGITLEGEISEEFVLNTAVIEDKLEDEFYYVKIRDNTSLKLDYEALSREYSLKGIFVRKMLDKLAAAGDNEKRRLEAALKLGVMALEEKEVCFE
jgi:DNA repair protein SbcD/Mre11